MEHVVQGWAVHGLRLGRPALWGQILINFAVDAPHTAAAQTQPAPRAPCAALRRGAAAAYAAPPLCQFHPCCHEPSLLAATWPLQSKWDALEVDTDALASLPGLRYLNCWRCALWAPDAGDVLPPLPCLTYLHMVNCQPPEEQEAGGFLTGLAGLQDLTLDCW